MLAFVTYSLTGHTLQPSVVFASLTLFNLLRLPLMLYVLLFFLAHSALSDSSPTRSSLRMSSAQAMNITPNYPLAVSFSAIADALTASHRLYDVFVAETFEDLQLRDDKLDVAVEVKDATFTWDGPPPQEEDGKKKKGKKATLLEKAASAAAALEQAKVDEEKVFKMTNLNFTIPRGQLVAIVGAVRHFSLQPRSL